MSYYMRSASALSEVLFEHKLKSRMCERDSRKCRNCGISWCFPRLFNRNASHRLEQVSEEMFTRISPHLSCAQPLNMKLKKYILIVIGRKSSLRILHRLFPYQMAWETGYLKFNDSKRGCRTIIVSNQQQSTVQHENSTATLQQFSNLSPELRSFI